MTTRIKLRRDTTANWAATNPVLALGEPGLDTTLNQVKYGDGVTAWADLEFASGSGGTVNGNIDISRPTQGLLTTIAPPLTDGYGTVYQDTAVLSQGNLYLCGGISDASLSSNIGFGNYLPLITKLGQDGTVVWSKYILQDAQWNGSYGSALTVNPSTSDIIAYSSQYFNTPSYAYNPVVHSVSSDGSNVISTRLNFGGNDAYITDADARELVFVGAVNNVPTNYANVQAHPGSYTHYLGLNISQTFGSNSTPTLNNGWSITGTDIGSPQAVTKINEFTVYNPNSNLAGNSSSWLIIYDISSNVYVINDFMGGSDYTTGEVITIHGNDLGGNITTNDLSITVGNVSSGAILDFTISGHAQTDLIWLYEDSGVDFSQPVNGTSVSWTLSQTNASNGFVVTEGWAKSIGGADYDNINGVATDSGGNVYIGGHVQSGYSTRDNTTAMVMKLNNQGVKQWTRFVDNGANNTVRGLAIDTAGNLVVSSGTNNGLFTVAKLNPTDGSAYWRTTMGEGDPMGYNTISVPVINNTGNIIVAGSLASAFSDGDDVFVTAFNTHTGNVIYQRDISAPKDQNIYWNNSVRALAVDDNYLYLSTWENDNKDQARIIKLPADGSTPGDLGNNWIYRESFWSSNVEIAPSLHIDSGDWVSVEELPYTATELTTTIADATPFEHTTYRDLLVGNGANIKGVKTITFEDGTEQTTAAIGPTSRFVGNSYATMDIRVYNGGINFYWNGNNDNLWFDSNNSPGIEEGLVPTGAIIEYQLYDDNNYGIQIGTIHVSGFFNSSMSATHTEHWTAYNYGSNNYMMYNQPWILSFNTNYNQIQLFYRGPAGRSANIKIQWTARVFYGQENFC